MRDGCTVESAGIHGLLLRVIREYGYSDKFNATPSPNRLSLACPILNRLRRVREMQNCFGNLRTCRLDGAL